ncbi:ACT domain-containing protein [Coprococcus comes]|uniref:ACT domain-containing protein n=1 Tax=Coprococcus comes TaxID=410072 RepID=UPI00321A0014
MGILSNLSGIFAERQIGIFVVSTYNTDYILVKGENSEGALNMRTSEEYIVVCLPIC